MQHVKSMVSPNKNQTDFGIKETPFLQHRYTQLLVHTA